MSTAIDSSSCNRFPLSRVLILLLAGAFAGLMVDIRVEHVEAVHERSVAWLPIIYSGAMTIACCCAFFAWNKTARHIMLPLFGLAFIVGAMGFYFHNDGHPIHVIRSSVQAWTDSKMKHSDEPPQVAPLAIGGLGLIGMLASLRRFNSSENVTLQYR